MIIRTGLLCIPTMDDAALLEVRRILREVTPQAVVMLESAVASQRHWIAETLRTWCDEEEMDLVLTLGGTLPAAGPSSQEIAPEATLDVLERQMPGLAEAMRADAVVDYPLALLDRGVSGIRGRTLVVNLPEGAAAGLFLAAVADLLPAVVSHLQGSADAPRLAAWAGEAEEVPGSAPEQAPPARRGLDAGEFAEWLKRSGEG